MSDVGFALAKLIIAADEVATVLELASLDRHRALGLKLRAALENVGVIQRSTHAHMLTDNPPLPAVKEMIPVVTYFPTRESAEAFCTAIRAAKPPLDADVHLPPQDKDTTHD